MGKRKKRRRREILANKLDHIAVKLGEIYAELMKTRYREKTKPSARIYSRYRKHRKREDE